MKILRIVLRLLQISLLVLGIGLILYAVPAYYSEYEKDHSVANLKAMMMALLGALVVVFSFVVMPGLHWLRRLAFLLAPAVFCSVFLLLFRLVGFSGEMLPVFEWRWASASPLLTPTQNVLESVLPDSPLASIYDVSKLRFHQFLGDNRDGIVSGVEIVDSWESSPPEIVWKHSIGAGWSGVAVEGRRVVTQEQRMSDGVSEEWITCYDLFTGELLWRHAYKSEHYDPLGGRGPRATPLIDNNSVYWQGAAGIVGKLHLKNGQQVWQLNLYEQEGLSEVDSKRAIPWGRSASPLLIGQRLVIPFGGNDQQRSSLIALNSENGDIIWKNGADQISYSSPHYTSFHGVEQIVSINEKTISSHAIDDGRTIWSFDWPGSSSGMANISQPVNISNNRLLLSKGYGVGAAVIKIEHPVNEQEKFEAVKVWSNESVLKTKFTSSIFRDGFAYGLSDGTLECVNLENGQRAWKKGRFGQGQMLRVGSHLLILSEDGRVVLVDADPKQFHQIGQYQVLEGTTWNTPAIAGPFLVVRNATEIACLKIAILNNNDFRLNPN